MPTNSVDQQRSVRPAALAALALLGAGWLAAPQGHAAAKGEWSDSASRDETFSRILIVGVSPNRNQRCGFERDLASRIRSADTAVVVSCDAMPADAPLTREHIETAVAAENADAVLATSLVSTQWETEEGGTFDTRGNADYKATDSYYGVYGSVIAVDFHTSDAITTVRGKAQVTSKLYETSGATVVYTVNTKVRNVQSTDAAIAAVTAPIRDRLQKAGLIR